VVNEKYLVSGETMRDLLRTAACIGWDRKSTGDPYTAGDLEECVMQQLRVKLDLLAHPSPDLSDVVKILQRLPYGHFVEAELTADSDAAEVTTWLEEFERLLERCQSDHRQADERLRRLDADLAVVRRVLGVGGMEQELPNEGNGESNVVDYR
jgi:hypothetical protein